MSSEDHEDVARAMAQKGVSFVFSSRRRHTRFDCDWSSDVCSSDLRESFERYSRTGGPVVIHTNTEPMVAAAITSPLTIIASDAYWQNGTGHPRTTGTFARVLGRYVREAHANVGAQHAAPLPTDTLSVMDAIRQI